jgi:membrane-bound serine protease (ClpP class)
MEFLLNPNIAYLLLAIGSFLVILAIFSPGTGILEIGALFILVLAGWAVYNLPINTWALVVLIGGVIPFIIAVRRSGKQIYLVIALLAFVIGSSFLFRGDSWWQPAVNPFLVLVVSILMGGYMWIGVQKVLEAEKRPPAHDLEALVGAEGEAKTDIHDQGSVQVAGELWSAFSQEAISSGTQVRVIARHGFSLEVAPVSKSKS